MHNAGLKRNVECPRYPRRALHHKQNYHRKPRVSVFVTNHSFVHRKMRLYKIVLHIGACRGLRRFDARHGAGVIALRFVRYAWLGPFITNATTAALTSTLRQRQKHASRPFELRIPMLNPVCVMAPTYAGDTGDHIPAAESRRPGWAATALLQCSLPFKYSSWPKPPKR